MKKRFSLYGFLKNQRYFEPFFLLVFMDRGLSFFDIGVLVSIREITVMVLEVPSGAIADIYGRRRSMIMSFSAYILSFLVFGQARSMLILSGAMVLFGIGEAFRTGTHKAMIFAWLRQQGRLDERTSFYGYTRSWSKYGSAVSTVIAAAMVFASGNYGFVFYSAIVPYIIAIINFMGYPDSVETRQEADRPVAIHMLRTVVDVFKARRLRRTLVEAMGFEGIFHSVKDYIQPVVMTAAVALAARYVVLDSITDVQRTSLFLAPVYILLYIASGNASRQAHKVVGICGSEERAARSLWGITAIVFAVVAVFAYEDYLWPVVVSLAVLHVIQNVWRPILITRLDARGAQLQGATLLSLESQSRRLATMALAPLIGWAVDEVARRGLGGSYWPIGVAGFLVAAAFFMWPRDHEEAVAQSY